eukprot:2181230-Amphidinium_carterae.2
MAQLCICPGVNNQYLIETAHELAIKYNDRSPLENFHCSKLFEILSQPEVQWLALHRAQSEGSWDKPTSKLSSGPNG